MTAPLLFASLEPSLVSPRFSAGAADYAGAKAAAARRSPRQASSQRQRATRTSSEASALDSIWGSLLESLHQGVIVTSRSLNPIYWNAKARALCQHLSGSEFPPLELPAIVSEVCHRLMREDCTSDRTLVMECQAPTGQTIRISARWLYLNTGSRGGTKAVQSGAKTADWEEQSQPYMLVLLENCHDLLQEELKIEQKKYDLTERETEVWMLLRQEYTYQEIAKMLQISLNTVKTHVKNVYAKKRSCQGREKFWCCD